MKKVLVPISLIGFTVLCFVILHKDNITTENKAKEKLVEQIEMKKEE